MAVHSGAPSERPGETQPAPYPAPAPSPSTAGPPTGPSNPAPEIVVIGAPKATWSDIYHLFLRARWSLAIAVIVFLYLAINTLFAGAYLLTGGIANARQGSFFDALCFSVETLGTIGYGQMYPTSSAAN